MTESLTIASLVGAGLSDEASQQLLSSLNAIPDSLTQQQKWRLVSKTLLKPDAHPFAVHQLVMHAILGSDAHPMLWTPDPDACAQTNIGRFMQFLRGIGEWDREATGDPQKDFALFQRFSWQQPELYWPRVLKALHVHFATQPTSVIEYGTTADECIWFPAARLNIAQCALSGANADQPAILYAAENNPTNLRTVTYQQLRTEAAQFGSALQAQGFRPGVRVAIIMPLTPLAVVAYLGSVLMGGAVVSIAESFAATEICSRLQLVQTDVVVTQDVMTRGEKALPLYPRVVEASAPFTVVIPETGEQVQQQLRPTDVSWAMFMRKGCPHSFQPYICDASDVTNILFSSGTTGEPKAIPWTHITPLKAGADAWAHQDVHERDVLCWPTSMGWMMGPWLVYATLMNNATMALFNGSPLGRPFGEFVAAARVNVLGLVPSIAKAWRASNCMNGLDWSSLRCFSSTGEASAPQDYHWLMARGGYVPIMEYCGGTEIGGAFLTGSMLQPQSPSTFSTPTMGTQLVLIASDGRTSGHGSAESITGELALVAPCLGSSQRLLNKDHFKIYYEGMPQWTGGSGWLRRHGDEVYRLPSGYYMAMGRTDDTMNLGGIKVSSVELERCVVKAVAAVKEAAAVSVGTRGGGPERLMLFLVLHDGQMDDTVQLKVDCNKAIKAGLSPLFKAEEVFSVSQLPRNASNKVMRRVLRDQLLHGSSPDAKL